MLNILQFAYNLFEEKAYIVWKETGRCVIVDPGFCCAEEKRAMLDALGQKSLKPEAILLTHAHFDHIYGVKELQDLYGIPVYMSPEDKVILEYDKEMTARFGLPAPDSSFTTADISDGETISAAGIRFEVISTPGHTPGGVCFLDREDGVLFTGDTLFAGAIGRTDFKYGEYDDEIRSIMEKLIFLDPETKVLPGHGPDTTIGKERTGNPFLAFQRAGRRHLRRGGTCINQTVRQLTAPRAEGRISLVPNTAATGQGGTALNTKTSRRRPDQPHAQGRSDWTGRDCAQHKDTAQSLPVQERIYNS